MKAIILTVFLVSILILFVNQCGAETNLGSWESALTTSTTPNNQNVTEPSAKMVNTASQSDEIPLGLILIGLAVFAIVMIVGMKAAECLGEMAGE